MKYHFTGAQGTGKTTLLNEARHYYPGFTFITEVVRNLSKTKNIKINELGNETSQMIIFNTYLESLLTQTEYISDRSLIDVISYTRYLAVNNLDFDINILNVQEILLDFIVKRNLLGFIFYVPIEFPLVEDGIRSNNENFRREVDVNIRYYLERFKIPYVVMSGSKEERSKILKEFI